MPSRMFKRSQVGQGCRRWSLVASPATELLLLESTHDEVLNLRAGEPLIAAVQADVSLRAWSKEKVLRFDRRNYNLHHHQALYDAVRGAGAPNLVLIGGLNYAYDLSGVPQHRVNGYNIVYATHPYDYPGKQPSEWMTSWGSLTATDPVMVTEFGQFDCGTDYVTSLLDFADQRQVSWSAWAWFPGGCDFPALLSDWSGAPTAAGEVVKARLGSY